MSHRRSDDLQRMRLRVEDELVRAPLARDLEDAVLVPQNQLAISASFFTGRTHRRVYQIGVLQHLGEQETLLHVEERSPVRGIDVRDGRETLTGPCRCIDGYEGIPCPVLVHRVTLFGILACRSRAKNSDV